MGLDAYVVGMSAHLDPVLSSGGVTQRDIVIGEGPLPKAKGDGSALSKHCLARFLCAEKAGHPDNAPISLTQTDRFVSLAKAGEGGVFEADSES